MTDLLVAAPVVTPQPTAPWNDYRAHLTCPVDDGWIDKACQLLADWLRSRKGFDVDPTRTGSHRTENRRLNIVHHRDRQGPSFLMELEEDTSGGRWTTTLIGHDYPGSGDWLNVHVANDRGEFANVPRLVRDLIEDLGLKDGMADLHDEPWVVQENNLDWLLDILCDESRHSLVFVAGTSQSGQDFEPFRQAFGRWTKETVGLAQSLVLSPATTAALQRAFGDDHAVQPWTVRTYLPGVDPASALDARRHRTLLSHRLRSDSDGRIQRLLGRVSRQHASSRVPQQEVQRVRNALRRERNRTVIDRLRSRPPRQLELQLPRDLPPRDHTAPLPWTGHSPQTRPTGRRPSTGRRGPAPVPLWTQTPAPVQVPDRKPSLPSTGHVEQNLTATRELMAARETIREQNRLLALVTEHLGLERISATTLEPIVEALTRPTLDASTVQETEGLLEGQAGTIAALESDLNEAKHHLEEDELDHAELRDLNSHLQEENVWLWQQLGTRQVAESAQELAPMVSADRPETFEDLLARLELLPHVRFTGQAKDAIQLDEVDTLNEAVKACWSVCLTLSDYARAKAAGDCEGSLDRFLMGPPNGYRTVPARWFAATESTATMQQFGDERIFPVPADVAAEGVLTMKAHFRLARIGMVSPRLYFYDGTAQHGCIFIGYIGRHLRNTQTN